MVILKCSPYYWAYSIIVDFEYIGFYVRLIFFRYFLLTKFLIEKISNRDKWNVYLVEILTNTIRYNSYFNNFHVFFQRNLEIKSLIKNNNFCHWIFCLHVFLFLINSKHLFFEHFLKLCLPIYVVFYLEEV